MDQGRPSPRICITFEACLNRLKSQRPAATFSIFIFGWTKAHDSTHTVGCIIHFRCHRRTTNNSLCPTLLKITCSLTFQTYLKSALSKISIAWGYSQSIISSGHPIRSSRVYLYNLLFPLAAQSRVPCLRGGGELSTSSKWVISKSAPRPCERWLLDEPLSRRSCHCSQQVGVQKAGCCTAGKKMLMCEVQQNRIIIPPRRSQRPCLNIIVVTASISSI